MFDRSVRSNVDRTERRDHHVCVDWDEVVRGGECDEEHGGVASHDVQWHADGHGGGAMCDCVKHSAVAINLVCNKRICTNDDNSVVCIQQQYSRTV